MSHTTRDKGPSRAVESRTTGRGSAAGGFNGSRAAKACLSGGRGHRQAPVRATISTSQSLTSVAFLVNYGVYS